MKWCNHTKSSNELNDKTKDEQINQLIIERDQLLEQNSILQSSVKSLQRINQSLKDENNILLDSTEFDFNIEELNIIGVEYIKETKKACISYIINDEYREWSTESSIENYNKILKHFQNKMNKGK